MRNQELNKSTPVLLIQGGGKNYELDLDSIGGFLDRCKERVNIDDVDELSTMLNVISDLVIDGTPDDYDAGEIKQPLKLLRELTYLFNGLLHERK